MKQRLVRTATALASIVALAAISGAGLKWGW
jgi:hypothetical protein